MRLASLDEQPFGLSWVLEEPMQRASHALVDGGRVWLIDPTDEPEALERARALGKPAAVLQLLDRHNRDSAAIAQRLGVPLERVPDALPGSPFEIVPLVSHRLWNEVGLWWPSQRLLVVPEAIGSAAMFAPTPAGAGVHIGLRLRPPRALAAYEPEHLLLGHGPALHGPGASRALHEARQRSRRDLPRAAVVMAKASASAARS